MWWIIIFGFRSFGRCDYFKTEAGETLYVTTQFFHISFLPLSPRQSYIAKEGPVYCSNTIVKDLPAIYRKCVVVAWIRACLFIGGILPLIILAISAAHLGGYYIHHHDGTVTYHRHTLAGWRIAFGLVFSVVCLAAGIGSQWYKPQASETKRLELLQILNTGGAPVAAPNVQAGTPQPINVQAQLPPAPYGQATTPAYAYNQASTPTFGGFPNQANIRGSSIA